MISVYMFCWWVSFCSHTKLRTFMAAVALTVEDMVRQLIGRPGYLCTARTFSGGVKHHLVSIAWTLVPEVRAAVAEQRMPRLPTLEGICLCPDDFPEEVALIRNAFEHAEVVYDSCLGDGLCLSTEWGMANNEFLAFALYAEHPNRQFLLNLRATGEPYMDTATPPPMTAEQQRRLGFMA
jgi:hypothetical protein